MPKISLNTLMICTLYIISDVKSIIKYVLKYNDNNKIKEKNTMKTYLDMLKDLREDNDYTQKEIANVLGTTQQMY